MSFAENPRISAQSPPLTVLFLFFLVIFGLAVATGLFILASDKAEAAGDILLFLTDLCEYVAFEACLEAVFAVLPMLERSQSQEIGIDQGEVKTVDITILDCIEHVAGSVMSDIARLSYGDLPRIDALPPSMTSSGDVDSTLDISEAQEISVVSVSDISLYATVPAQKSISRNVIKRTAVGYAAFRSGIISSESTLPVSRRRERVERFSTIMFSGSTGHGGETRHSWNLQTPMGGPLMDDTVDPFAAAEPMGEQ
ncbi:uncharacterized protein BT62DRAFT_1008232 [Guyanagaster necrorhizus]|uniref:Uncharacterized protein n=1 Tax=Guyanagaster necrorhizus TaxID=856835 RepID=A0A9P7VPU8_9AGAR|nr:uncharacterized protein BT62DRAFT_1008232 [Guyanagaster necrorhizus MCA 3950]KAG7444572.1 hypothetical protein BT62DRAFT_1008232 [Guyanagaster necrorhizus MCA 3950]